MVGMYSFLTKEVTAYFNYDFYLLGCLFDQIVWISSLLQDGSHEIIHIGVVLPVRDALWLNDQEALERMHDFLNGLPLLSRCFDSQVVASEDLIDLLVLLYVGQ